MNRDRIKSWLTDLENLKWVHCNEFVDIAHSKQFNLYGTLADYYLDKNKKRWADYLWLVDTEEYNYKRENNKYIKSENVDIGKLMKDVYEWFEVDDNFFYIYKFTMESPFLETAFLIRKHYNILRNEE